MKRRLLDALEWCGFTPTARERYLEKRLRRVVQVAVADRQRLTRVEELLHYREGLDVGTVDTDSLRAALLGEESR